MQLAASLAASTVGGDVRAYLAVHHADQRMRIASPIRQYSVSSSVFTTR